MTTARPLALALDFIISPSVAYSPEHGVMGYSWITDRLVEIHPDAFETLQARMTRESERDLEQATQAARNVKVNQMPRDLDNWMPTATKLLSCPCASSG
jgi:hypothetical protein